MTNPARGIILFDGDNIQGSVRDFHGRREVPFGSLTRWLKARYGIDPLVEATVFISTRKAAQHGKAAYIRAQGLNARVYPILDGHGYQDDELSKYASKLADRFDILVLATSDSDFVDLASDMRNRGKKVFGIGCERSTQGYWLDAFDDFYYLEDALDGAKQGVLPIPIEV